MSLPLPWVDRIFEKLTLTYGQAFLARWRDIDINAVKSDWMHELSGFQQSPSRIAFALENLPDRPPSVIEFKTICRAYSPPDVQKLAEPKADPARVATELAKLVHLRVPAAQSVGGKAWASAVMSSTLPRTPTVVQMAKSALGLQ